MKAIATCVVCAVRITVEAPTATEAHGTAFAAMGRHSGCTDVIDIGRSCGCAGSGHTQPCLLARPEPDCECGEGGVPGVIGLPVPGAPVQRCDLCERFPGDLDAALALAVHQSMVVLFVNDRGLLRIYTAADADDDTIMLAPGSDPWLVPEGANALLDVDG